ncbi:MAG: selenide, water dikinase SelD [Acidiferrobacterales bacterium]
MQGQSNIVLKDLVLVGGGHSHVAVLKAFGMRPENGVRLTLVTRDIHTPYSGMLPGYIAGHYGFDDSHIDLRPLARFAGCRIYHDEMVGLDLANRRVLCSSRPPVPYDFVSIDTGSTPYTTDIPGATEYALSAKPVDRFLTGWGEIEQRAIDSKRPFRIIVVGAGAGGVELTLALQHRLSVRHKQAPVEFRLFSDTPQILPTHNLRVRQIFARILAERGIIVHTGHRIEEVTAEHVLYMHSGAVSTQTYDALIWVTQAAAPSWLAHTGLATTVAGFVEVDDFLRSTSHPEVFAAGDVATMRAHAREKSGVIAVRQGPPLAINLRRALTNQRLRRFIPQRRFLALISTGDKYAVASRGPWALEGAILWRWKNWIDHRWMQRYHQLPSMPDADAKPAASDRMHDGAAIQEISSWAMRCGGCGSKIGSTVLSRVLARIPVTARADVLVGLADADDAAVVAVPPGKLMVHTVDFFRAIVDDPFLFGRIAANHSLGDIYAMGAEPQSALAVATVPFGPEAKMEQTLYDLMAGASTVLEESGTALVGGHTSEGFDLAFGLCVNGLVGREKLLRKSGMLPGDQLILTKALGTGTLFAADMRHQAKGRWIDAALGAMLQSSYRAVECLMLHGAHACTDVTGFGLLGHLLEMTRPSSVDAEIDLDNLPAIDGALEALTQGIFSSLQPENIRLRRAIRNLTEAARHTRYPLLFDPQTAGGMLAAVPKENAGACVAALHALGYVHSAVIGRIQPLSDAAAPIVLNL